MKTPLMEAPHVIFQVIGIVKEAFAPRDLSPITSDFIIFHEKSLFTGVMIPTELYLATDVVSRVRYHEEMDRLRKDNPCLTHRFFYTPISCEIVLN